MYKCRGGQVVEDATWDNLSKFKRKRIPSKADAENNRQSAENNQMKNFAIQLLVKRLI